MTWKETKSLIIESHSPQNEEYQKAEEIYEKVSEFVESKFNKDTKFVGSAARQTSLKGDIDLDIFILFDENTSELSFERKGLEIGEKVIEEFGNSPVKEYAEHPYVKGKIEGFDVDLVPAYDAEPDQINSSVDRTPHHSDWVKNNLSKEQIEDVVILKQFLKANGLYGSSQKKLGFSGYLCEVLIEYYGDFPTLMGEARKWGQNEVIDPEGHWEGSETEEVIENFSGERFVVVDPVDPNRNVASVLSREKLANFILLAIEFIQNPDISFFENTGNTVSDKELNEILEKRGHVVVLEFDRPEEVESKLYPQARKLKRLISQKLEDRGFAVYESGVWIGSQDIRVILETELPERSFRENLGPKPFHNIEDVERYMEEHPNYSLRDTRLVERKTRDFQTPDEYLRELRETENPRRMGVPKDFREIFYQFRIVNPKSGTHEWRTYLSELLEI